MIDNKRADALICAVAKGDNGALEELYCEMAPSVYAFARSIIKNDAAAQDIMQDTFVRVFNSAAGFSSKGFGKAWIMQIARNLSLNFLSRCDRFLPDDAVPEKASYESTEETAEARVMIQKALETLADDERQIVMLHSVSGMKLEEIADILDEPLGTVKWRHSKAMKKIRAAMSAGEEA